MCGITGYVGLDDEALLRRMCASLEHRGPDDDGFFTAAGVGLAMRRLSIIDLESGKQPIANETGDVHVVFNGEIYNYQELTARLKSAGHRFKTSSDTETIVHLYEDHGLDFAAELRGMFGIAIWDAPRRRLVLARDRVGEKPLYYAFDGKKLLFGSEIKAILQAQRSRAVDAQSVCEFLALGYVPSPGSFFDGIKKLAPGEMLVFENGELQRRMFSTRDTHCRSTLSFDEASQTLRDTLDESVRLCLRSDVEVGAFLSGGLDSSMLVALMRHHNTVVQTFSVGYEGEASGFNELNYARRVADDLGTRHHELIIGAQSTMEMLPKILWHYDEPHGEPTSVLVYQLCEFTKRKVKVAVGGTGGDEIFFGYPRHAGIRMLTYYRLMPRWIRENVVERVVMKWPESTRGSRFAKRAKRFVGGAGGTPHEAYLSWVSLLGSDVRDSLLSDKIKTAASDPAGDAFLRDWLTDDARGDLFERAAGVDVAGYLPDYQLAFMDRMSMAHGLEVRSPLCDHILVDYVLSLPASYRLRGTRTKHIFKEVARDWIPREIAERKKVGFDSPIGQWFKKDLRDFIVGFLAPDQLAQSGLLDPQGVQRVLGDHLSGKSDYSLQLWSLMALEGWHRMYIEDGVTDGREYRLTDMRGIAPQALPSSGKAVAWDGGRKTARESTPVMYRTTRLRSSTGLKRKMWDGAPRVLKQCAGPILSAIPQPFLLGKDFRNWFAFAESTRHWDADQFETYQVEQLRQVCRRAYALSPFYRDWFDRAGFDPEKLARLEDLHLLPTINRDVVAEHGERMCTVALGRPGVNHMSTGGTDGKPLEFYINADRSAIEYAYLIASWKRIAYEPGAATAVFRGRVVAPDLTGFRHEYDPLLRHHYYSTFHMNDENMRRYIEHVAALGPCFLHVYPSSVSALARFIERNDMPAPRNVRGVIAESEIVHPDQHEAVERVFGCRYFSCYGHSEKLVLAAACEHSDDYHVWPTYGCFELLDEHGRPVTTPGERGEIVGTGFINTVMPFIRYRTGDKATYVGDRCEACGRNHPLIRDIRGHRTQEMLVLSDETHLSWTALNMHDDTFRNVRQFQFFQERAGHAVLRIVPADAFRDADQSRILRQLEQKLDNRLNLTIKIVDSIRLTGRGKAIYVEQRIPAAELLRV